MLFRHWNSEPRLRKLRYGPRSPRMPFGLGFHLHAHQEKQQAHRNLSFCPFGNASIARFERIQNPAGAFAPGRFDQVDFRSWVGRPLPFRRSVLLALGIKTSSSAIFSSYPFSRAIATPSRAS